jgi:hypothetical protein
MPNIMLTHLDSMPTDHTRIGNLEIPKEERELDVSGWTFVSKELPSFSSPNPTFIFLQIPRNKRAFNDVGLESGESRRRHNLMPAKTWLA